MQICVREGPFGSEGLVLLLLGDLIDRGPKSAQLTNFVRHLATVFPEVIVLKGNHEDTLVDAWKGDREALSGWLAEGGIDTIESFGSSTEALNLNNEGALMAAVRGAIPEKTIAWLDSLPLSDRRGDYLFVHAGIRPGLPIEQQEASDLLWIRDEFLDFAGSHGPVVVHGHTISNEVRFAPNRIGIDSGAYRTGKLAALRLEGTSREVLIASGSPRPLVG